VAGWIFLIIEILNFLAIIAMVFWERKTPQSTLLWILTFALLPILGFILYLFFGNGARFGRHKQYLHKAYEDELYNKEFEKQFKVLSSIKTDSENISQMIHFNLCQSKALCTVDNSIELYVDMKKMFEQIFVDIANAKETIHLEYFIFKNDSLGKKLLNALTIKASEGIKVKVLYDDLGALKTKKHFFKPLIKAGGQVERFFASKIRLINVNMNYRNHRKIIVIDNKIGYTGGANIGKEYIGEHKRIKPWRDTQIRVTGDIAQMLNIRFISDFSFAANKDYLIFPSNNEKKLKKNASNIANTIKREFKKKSMEGYVAPENYKPMQLVVSGPDTKNEEIKSAYTRAIYLAKKRILLQTPYFIPDSVFFDALINASRSGVEVKLIIPKLPDKKYIYYATMSYAKQLLKYGIKVYLYNGFIHSKTLVVDDEISSVGTFNIDMRSAILNFENTIFIYDKQFCDQMVKEFNNDKNNSIVLTEEYVKKRPKLERALEKFMRLLTPLF